ncbi:protein YIPF6 isoform 2-T2 [Liasis olivaceus]
MAAATAAEEEAAGGGATKPLFAGLADVSISEDIPVEGEITVPVGPNSPDEDYSTLDEPVKETVMRDLKAVGKKFVHVMYPKKSSTLLRDCRGFMGSINPVCFTCTIFLSEPLCPGLLYSATDRGSFGLQAYTDSKQWDCWLCCAPFSRSGDVWLVNSSIYSLPGRQPAPKPQSPCCLSHFPFLFCYQLDDPHLYTIVNVLLKRLQN